MYYICEKTIVQSILENLNVKKYIKQKGKLYEFHIQNNTLLLSVYSDDAPPLLIETHILETNIKGEFSICEDEQNIIHVVAANKKYDLIYIRFDGENLKKETIYTFNHNYMIPTTPVIQVKNDLIAIVVEFLTTGTQKEWSLRAYVKRNSVWDCTILDKGMGLCYTQPDFKLDEQLNLHLIYREYKEKSYLKYICFDAQKPRQGKPKMIMDSEIDQYNPLIFVNRFNEAFVSWMEINVREANLCCANISTESNKELFKVDVSQNIEDVRIYFSGWHIYCIFQSQEGYYYDMCCRKKLVKQWNPKIIPKKGGAAMSSDFRQFLDIKRELEYKITELKKQGSADQYEKTIGELKQQNINLSKQIGEREQAIEAARNECQLLRVENEKYKNNVEQSHIQKSSIPMQNENEKKSIWSSFLHFFSD